jgi:hypothetical protein
MKAIRGCLCFLIYAGLSSSAYAGVIASASASWAGQVCSGLWPFGEACQGTVTPVGGSTSQTGTSVVAGLTIPSPGEGGIVASASAAYASISVEARGNTGELQWRVGSCCTMGRLDDNPQSSASASFQDTITILGGVGSGTLEAIGSLGFFVQPDDGPRGITDLSFGVGTAGQFLNFAAGDHSASFDLLTPFAFGVPFNISGNASASAGDYQPNDPNVGAEYARSSVSFSSLLVFDANGQPLSGYTYSSASEARYPLQAGTFVPEPKTGQMALLALACISCIRVARRVRARVVSD